MKYCALSLITGILFLLLSCHQRKEAGTFPQEEWKRHPTPERVGWSIEGRDKLRNYLQDRTAITGLVIVHEGQLVFEYGDISENSYIASCRKSILSILYGKHVQNGAINLEETLGSLGVKDRQSLLLIEKRARVKDLLAARSGVYLPGSNGGDFRRFAPERGSVNPGSYWLYNNWDFNVAGYIFESMTQSSIYDELERQLAIPLQFQDWDPSLQRKVGDSLVSIYPAYHMWLSTRDMARIGLLLLSNGRWENEQLISLDWINEMLTTRTSYQEAQLNVPLLKEDGLNLGYGYMWWLIQNEKDPRLEGAFSAQGAIGQGITVFPKINTVLAYKTNPESGGRNSIQTQMNIIKNVAKVYRPN